MERRTPPPRLLFAQAEHKKNCTELGHSSTEVSPRPVVPVIVWTGALRTTPLDAGPHSITDPDPVLWSTRCSTVRSPTLNSRESVSKHTYMGGGYSQEVGRSVGGWVGKDRKTA